MNLPGCMKKIFLFISLLTTVLATRAQVDPDVRKETIRQNRANSQSQRSGTETRGIRQEGPRKDSLAFERRNDAKDSITVTFRYLDSTRRLTLDSSINDFDNYFSIPSGWLYLGNNGSAARPIVFTPYRKPGWDPGFHAFDLYRYTLEGTKFYKTSRPFSMLSYQLASGKEQMLKAMHTQNPRPNLNHGYR